MSSYRIQSNMTDIPDNEEFRSEVGNSLNRLAQSGTIKVVVGFSPRKWKVHIEVYAGSLTSFIYGPSEVYQSTISYMATLRTAGPSSYKESLLLRAKTRRAQ